MWRLRGLRGGGRLGVKERLIEYIGDKDDREGGVVTVA